MSKKELVSIITPLYYGKKYIKDLLQMIEKNSIEAKDVAEIEWVISNDCPDEHIEDICNSFFNIVVLNTDENVGIQGARVKGLDACSGGYVLFLDQDDFISDDWVKSQLECIGDNDAVVCDCEIDGMPVYNNGIIPALSVCVTKEYNLSVRHGFIPGQVLIRSKKIPELWKKKWLKYNCCDDYYLWLCMFATGCTFGYNPRKLYKHNFTGQNLSFDTYTWLMSTNEMLHEIENGRIYSDDEIEMIKSARQKEIQGVLDDYKWTRVRCDVYRRLLSFYEDKKLDISMLRGKSVAVYGEKIGKSLYYLLKKEGIDVRGVIDQHANYIVFDIPIFSISNIPDSIQVIILTMLKKETRDTVRKELASKYSNVETFDYEELLIPSD